MNIERRIGLTWIIFCCILSTGSFSKIDLIDVERLLEEKYVGDKSVTNLMELLVTVCHR